MIVRSKIQSFLHEKKRLSINSSEKSCFSISNNPIQKSFEQKKKQSNFKNTVERIQQFVDSPEPIQKNQFPSLQKQNFHRKLSRSLSKKQFQLIQKKNNTKGLKLKKTNERTQNQRLYLPLLQNHSQIEERRATNEQKKGFQNNRLRISSLLSNQTSKQFNFKKLNGEDSNSFQNFDLTNYFTRNNENQLKIRRQVLHKEENQPQPRSNFSNKLSLSNTQGSKYHQLQICSNLVSIFVRPETDTNIKVSTQVQTIQQQKQFFQYLKYKRRKCQFQEQLESQFSELEMIKDDRKKYTQRVAQLQNSKCHLPKNQRQKRIFNLKSQMISHQIKMQNSIKEKCKSFQNFAREIQNLEENTKKDCEHFIEMKSKYFQLINKVLLQHPEQKYLRISKRLEKMTENFINNTSLKIEKNIKDGMLFKQQTAATQLKEKFDQYKKSVLQYKGLLKNCFNHIKKIPQLCYALYGNKLPAMNIKSKLKNQNNEFQLPKCMQCFNSEWKFHMIIQKNILMQQIVKVTQELLKC